MTLLALLALSTRQEPNDDAARLDAVRKVVALAREVEAACQPRFRTSPPTPVQVVPDLPMIPAWAEKSRWGKRPYYVGMSNLSGFVYDREVTILLTPPWRMTPIPRIPEGARPWTPEELLASARAALGVVLPEGFVLGPHWANENGTRVTTDILVGAEPRLVAYEVGMRMDRWTGLPEDVRRDGYRPAIAPERLGPLRPEAELVEEALRVHRNLPPTPANQLSRAKYVYRIPAFSGGLNEMTPEHLGHEARREAIPVYEWTLVNPRDRGYTWFRTIYVDAHTGRGIAAGDLQLASLGESGDAAKTPVAPTTGRWRLGKAEGTFAKADPATFEGVPTVVTNAAGEVLALRFDNTTGLVRDDAGTYRPDDALLKAIQAEPPPKPFGRSSVAR